MTIEGIPEPSFEGDSFTERDRFLFPSSETSVTFSVAAAPMPSDCGTYVNRIRVCGEQRVNREQIWVINIEKNYWLLILSFSGKKILLYKMDSVVLKRGEKWRLMLFLFFLLHILLIMFFNFFCFFSMCGWMFLGLDVELHIVLRCKIALIKLSPSCVCITLLLSGLSAFKLNVSVERVGCL